MILPPGIGREDFAAAIAQFQAAIGTEWVFTSDDDLKLYRDAYSPYWNEPEERLASAAVAPASTEEVQAVVRIANAHRLPIYAISTGKNLGYGGSAPTYSGSVVLDLKRMDRILEVDEKQAYCLVEPGVSYFDMYRYLQDNKIKLWLDVPDPGWGSMLGNAIDRGAGYTASQFPQPFRCALRHGGGAGQRRGAAHRHGGNAGLADVAALQDRLRPLDRRHLQPVQFRRRHQDGLLADARAGSLPQGRGASAALWRSGAADRDHDASRKQQGVQTAIRDLNSPLLGTPSLAGLHEFLVHGPQARDADYAALLKRGAKPEEYEPYGLKHGIPFWSCAFTFYGPEKVIRAQWEHVQERFRAAFAEVTFEEREFYRTPMDDEQRQKAEYPAQFGAPNLRTFSIGARSVWNPGPPTDGHIWFSPIIPRSAEAVLRINEAIGEAARKFDIPMSYAMNVPVPCWERSFIFIIAFPILHDPAANKKTREPSATSSRSRRPMAGASTAPPSPSTAT